MFKFLKEKLKKVISKTTETIDEVGETSEEERIVEEKEESKESQNIEVKEENSEKKDDDSAQGIDLEGLDDVSLEEVSKDSSDALDSKEEATKSDKDDSSQKPKKEGFFKKLFKKKEEKEEGWEEVSKDSERKDDDEVKKDNLSDSEDVELDDSTKDSSDALDSKEEIIKPDKTDFSEKEKEDNILDEDKKGESQDKPEKELSRKDLKVDDVSQAKDDLYKEDEKKASAQPSQKEESSKEDLIAEKEITGKEELEIEEPETKITKESIEDLKEESHKEEEKDSLSEEEKAPLEEKKGFFAKIKEKFVTKKINESQFEDLFFELEIILLENNVAVEIIEKIKSDLKEKIVDIPINRNQIEKTITSSLKSSIEELFEIESKSLLEKIKEKPDKPYVISFLGINGSGKTTSIAKVAKLLLNQDKKIVLAAADTFRAAAIDQLQIHADNLGVRLIKHDYGSDPAAVAYDAIKHAEAKDIDVVLIDTAGRIHSNSNLMEEMKKIIRVAKPDMKIFVGESITGNDCTEQAKKFNQAVGIDGIILTKADVDEKGGAAISIGYVTGKPIFYIGTGQEYEDLREFDSSLVIKSLGLE